MVVILNNIRSLYNVGSIFRTADAAGIEKIYLCGITPEPYDVFGKPREQLIKVSLGAEKNIKWEYAKSAPRLIDKLKKDKFKIFAIEQAKNSISYNKFKLKGDKGKIALILGAEVNGLPEVILKKCDKVLEIPMRGMMFKQINHPRHQKQGKESLNVSVAFGVVVFQLMQ